MSTATTTHQGWIRQRHGPWHVCCSATSDSACWRMVLDQPRYHEACVLPIGRTPADHRKRRAMIRDPLPL